MSKIDCGYYRNGKCSRFGEIVEDISKVEVEDNCICIYNVNENTDLEDKEVCRYMTPVYTEIDYLNIVKETFDKAILWYNTYEYKFTHSKFMRIESLVNEYAIAGHMYGLPGDYCDADYHGYKLALMIKHHFDELHGNEIIYCYHLAKVLNIKLDTRIIHKYLRTTKSINKNELDYINTALKELNI